MKVLLGISLSILLTVGACDHQSDLPLGSFYAVIPCADCPGISYELTLKEDSTFTERMVYQERSEEIMETIGKFSMAEGNVISLDKGEDKGMRLFRIWGDSLQMLDSEGKAIDSPMAERYYLSRNQPENFNMMLKKKTFIGFKATGNEPFWSLTIDFHKQMVFHLLGGDSLITPVPEPIRPQDIDAVSYRSETEKGTLHVTIFRQPCQDSMSGNEFGYTVRVGMKMDDVAEFRQFEGCGDYQGDYRLNDIWALESINGKELEIEGKVPNLEFNLRENRFFGFGGCNRINGTITIQMQEVTFGKTISTQMACPNLKHEDAFIKLLNDQTYGFKIGGLKLTLSNDQNTLVFRKVD